MFKRKIIPCNPKLKEFAKKLRKQGILSEVILWNNLKRRQRYGYDFHRQKPILDYIVDFFSPDLMLAIEVDGGSHWGKNKEDELRDFRLRQLGITVLRFNDSSVKNNLFGVLEEIDMWIEAHPGADAPPLQGGESHPGLATREPTPPRRGI